LNLKNICKKKTKKWKIYTDKKIINNKYIMTKTLPKEFWDRIEKIYSTEDIEIIKA
jgi:hypothetical protein